MLFSNTKVLENATSQLVLYLFRCLLDKYYYQ